MAFEDSKEWGIISKTLLPSTAVCLPSYPASAAVASDTLSAPPVFRQLIHCNCNSILDNGLPLVVLRNWNAQNFVYARVDIYSKNPICSHKIVLLTEYSTITMGK